MNKNPPFTMLGDEGLPEISLDWLLFYVGREEGCLYLSITGLLKI
jgi:hypothetical protein